MWYLTISQIGRIASAELLTLGLMGLVAFPQAAPELREHLRHQIQSWTDKINPAM
jgi:hypothetical protein